MRFIWILAVICLFGCLAQEQPSIKRYNESAILISSYGNFSYTQNDIEQSIPSVNTTDYKINALSMKTVKSSMKCDYPVYPISSDAFRLYSPEYYISPPVISGNDLSCSHLPVQSKWNYSMIGKLWEPKKSNASTGILGYDTYLATNCYSSGMMPMDMVYFLYPGKEPVQRYSYQVSMENNNHNYFGILTDANPELKFDNIMVKLNQNYICPKKNLVIYKGMVRDGDAYDALVRDINRAKTDFEYRVTQRDKLIQSIDKFMTTNVDGCSYDSSQKIISCKQDISNLIDVYIIEV